MKHPQKSYLELSKVYLGGTSIKKINDKELVSRNSDRSDFFSTLSPFTVDDDESHFISLGDRGPLGDTGDVYEIIVSVFSGYEAEAFSFIEKFYLSAHFSTHVLTSIAG